MVDVSVIEISPNFVEMIICQKLEDEYEIIEKVREEINLFKGYQKTRKVSFEKIKKLCEILKKMRELSENYGSYEILTITTSSFNQLDNALFLLDQIEIHTGLQVDMPKLLEKKKLLFKKFLKYRDEITSDKKSTLILNIGSSTTDLVFLHKRKLIKNQIISTGGYKIAEFISEENLTPEESQSFIEDYIYNYLIEIKKELGRKKVTKLVLIGEVREMLMKKIRKGSSVLSLKKEEIEDVIAEVEELSFKNFAKKYKMSEMVVLKSFVEFSMMKTTIEELSIKEISVLSYDNKELLVYEYFYPEMKMDLEEQMWELTLQASRGLGSKYHFHPEHSEFTLNLSKKMFDSLKIPHKIPEKIFKYIEVATLLHDIGKYINFKEHNEHSEYITRNSSLFGLTESDLEFISFLCYAHSGEQLEYSKHLEVFSSEERIHILKALAILKIAAALDRSKKQKGERVEVSAEGGHLHIDVYSKREFLIEKLFFNRQVKFFKEIFGVAPELHINRRYYGERI